MGRRIRLLRREKGISQTELAGHLGLSFQQMQIYEKGINRIGAARLRQIAKMLGVDIPFLRWWRQGTSRRLLRAYTAIKDKVVRRHQFVTR